MDPFESEMHSVVEGFNKVNHCGLLHLFLEVGVDGVGSRKISLLSRYT